MLNIDKNTNSKQQQSKSSYKIEVLKEINE